MALERRVSWGRRTPALLDSQQRRSVSPHLFDPIEVALIDIENVDDDITVVEQDPAGRWGAFDPSGPRALFFELLQHIAVDRPQLPFIFTRADDETIGHRRGGVDIDDDGVARRGVGDDLGDANREIPARRVQRLRCERGSLRFGEKGEFRSNAVPPIVVRDGENTFVGSPGSGGDEPSYRWARQDSNLRPWGYEPRALPLSYRPEVPYRRF